MARTGNVPGNQIVVPTYVCPADPSMSDGVLTGGVLAGSSYGANAQVFAQLQGEMATNGPDGKNGAMQPPTVNNWTDRGISLARILDGTSNTILFIHAYAQCSKAAGAKTGSVWGYTEGAQKAPATVQGYQPWQRASVLGQVYMGKANEVPFQNMPNPYATNCDPSMPASPHANVMIVALGDASVRSLVPTLSASTWNLACLPNNGQPLGPDW
jgi:hypothetical protein